LLLIGIVPARLLRTFPFLRLWCALLAGLNNIDVGLPGSFHSDIRFGLLNRDVGLGLLNGYFGGGLLDLDVDPRRRLLAATRRLGILLLRKC
jgi:hypothetical protein